MNIVETERISSFDTKKGSFGRHETFPLRFSWLTKGFQALSRDSKIFLSDDATVTLGVGRNMVNAIRHWLLAARLIKTDPKGLLPNTLGDKIFGSSGFDPYLEDEGTLWLIHWLIATNPKQATGWYWFFNCFHKAEFTSQEVATSLFDFADQNIQSKFSATTVKQDATILLRMYVRSRGNTRTPIEEALDSPLSLLNLISKAEGTTCYSRPAEREELPLGIFGFAVAELYHAMEVQELPIEILMYSNGNFPSPGAVFRLTENALIAKLEKLIHLQPGIFEIRETAGIHQLYLLEQVDPVKFLEFHYAEQSQEQVA